ncbi:MAG: glycosyltransferase [Candidatus Xenobia bacterium]
MFNGEKVSVVFSTYREKDSLRAAIQDFLAGGLVDEVVVVNNNAEPGTDEAVEGTGALLVHETKQGYGWGYQRGIAEATGFYVILSEPDGTFNGADVEKLLVYGREYPVVFASRTNQSAILEGSAMGLTRKLANVFVAKVLEVLFGTNALTDVGCTYKLFHRPVLEELSRHWRTHDALFATELQLLVVTRNVKFIEIPVTFKERVGESTLTGRWIDLARWGVRIALFIVSFWLRWMLRGRK